MTPAQVIEVGRDLLWTAMLVALPAMGVSLVLGLVISIFQTVTSIQEQTLSYVPRLVAVALAMILTMAWTMQIAVEFAVRMLWRAAEVGR